MVTSFGQRLARNDCHPYPANVHAVLLLASAHCCEHVAKANVVEMNAKPEINDVFELRCLFGFQTVILFSCSDCDPSEH
jgi:hypothetical protein